MGETTGIAWTDATFNPWIGCEKVSPACDNCYAEQGSARIGARNGLKLWQGDRYFTGVSYWQQPHRWERAAALAGVRRRVFCASFADVFEDRTDLLGPRLRLWSLIQATPHLDWLLLTKRPQHVEAMVPWGKYGTDLPVAPRQHAPWPNVWLGTTAETQEHYDARWPLLAAVPAVVRFISHEPALGPMMLTHTGGNVYPDWVITGGESGPRARPYELEWAEALVQQCQEHRIACFVKQWGSRPYHKGMSVELRAKKGDDPTEWRPELDVRQFPTPGRPAA